jgi:hypothetical protein
MHEAWFDPARVRIVEVSEEPVGVLDAEDRGVHIYISRIEVTPEWQGRGVGVAVLDEVCPTADPCNSKSFSRIEWVVALPMVVGGRDIERAFWRALPALPGRAGEGSDRARTTTSIAQKQVLTTFFCAQDLLLRATQIAGSRSRLACFSPMRS